MMMAFCPEHPKWDQNPKFTPLSETTSIPTTFICGVPPPPGAKAMKQRRPYWPYWCPKLKITSCLEIQDWMDHTYNVTDQRWAASHAHSSYGGSTYKEWSDLQKRWKRNATLTYAIKVKRVERMSMIDWQRSPRFFTPWKTIGIAKVEIWLENLPS